MINQRFAEGVKPNVTAKMEQPDSGLQKTDFLTPYTIIKALHAGNESPFFSDSTPFYKINLGCLYPEIFAKENSNRAIAKGESSKVLRIILGSKVCASSWDRSRDLLHVRPPRRPLGHRV